MSKVTIERTCRVCGKHKTLEVSEKGYYLWHQGALIQDVLPEISLDDRELLISSICSDCYNRIFQ